MIKVAFDWDERKNESNIRKHGLSFYEAQNAFFDSKRIIAEDLKHSEKKTVFLYWKGQTWDNNRSFYL